MTGAPYVIERVRATPAGNVTYQVVTDTLQRASVTIPRQFATGDQVDAIIARQLAAVLPLRVPYTGPFGE